MAEFQKFIFDNNYSTEAENVERIKQKKMLDARNMMSNELEMAKKQAFEEGFQEGQKMALTKLKAEMDLHINTIIENIVKINDYKPQLQELYEQHSTACVRHIAKNMFFKSEELFSENLLMQSLENSLNNLPMVSKILIKIPVNCKGYIEDTQVIEKIKERGVTDFAFVEDHSLHSGECRIEWDTSGVYSSKVESFEKINSTFAAFLSPEDLELSDTTDSLAPAESLTAGKEDENETTEETKSTELAEETTDTENTTEQASEEQSEKIQENNVLEQEATTNAQTVTD